MDIQETVANVTSIPSRVVFDNVGLEYSCNENLVCEYHFNNYTPQEGDRIGIFKLGWSQCKDYLVFEWVPIGFGSAPINEVCFYKQRLPRDSTVLYQFCYISGNNILHAASQPFHFCDKYHQPLQHDVSEENRRLRKENELLRETLQTIVSSRDSEGCWRNEVTKLGKSIGKMQEVLSSQQAELSEMKQQMEHISGRDRLLSDCSDCEIVDLGELSTIPPFPFVKV